MSSSKPFENITARDKQTILKVARHAIQYGLTYKSPPLLELENYTPQLQAKAATFVTLKETNKLRGCIGTLEAYQPLIQDVAEHAYAAAFNDPRFPPVNSIEEPMLHISISLLSSPDTISLNNEQELVAQLEPRKTGLILEYGPHKATYLPSVWEQISSPQEFVSQLKRKAGLAEQFWDDSMTFKTYYCEMID